MDMETILIEKNIMIPMRDGVRLSANVFRPGDGTPQPVILARTPYDKNAIVNGDDTINLMRLVQAGYVIVVQDTRGRFASEGEGKVMFQEIQDGYDTVAWAAAQPWSSGAVGTFGGSYLGNTQWLAALAAPEALRATAPLVTWSDLYEGMLYIGGAHVLHGLVWSAAMALEEINRRVVDGRLSREEAAALTTAVVDPNVVLQHLPIGDHPALRTLGSQYLDWLAHPTPDAYWQTVALSSHYGQITAPALNIGGWYDCFVWGTLQNYSGLRRNGGSKQARQHTRLVIGPWTHGGFSGVYPEREFGPAASALACDLIGTHLRWYDYWLKGVENGIEQEKPVKIFVMGIDQWREEDDWPLPDARERCYYLHSDGKANSLNGDGTLSLELPDQEPEDIYLYNPRRPLPTMGGQVLIVGNNTMGPRDQRLVEARDDVLVYSTPPLEQAVEVTGPIALRLFVASSAPDTDFTGKLVDVFPDGKAINLTDGALRARYHKSLSEPALLEPGRIYELYLDLWATANVFLPGHRIRLEVSSSNFPKLSRNSNSGGDIINEGLEQFVPAVNRIFHDRQHPSHLILPVVERKL
jgi:putative CocE/NonD family hydrolase